MMNQVYASLWNKYRPVIIQLMLTSEGESKTYKLSSHEFKGLNPKEKSYSFTLQAHKGKAVNNIKKSPLAQDLLYMLGTSRKASELMSQDSFEFTLDKQFVLHVQKLTPAPAPEATVLS